MPSSCWIARTRSHFVALPALMWCCLAITFISLIFMRVSPFSGFVSFYYFIRVCNLAALSLLTGRWWRARRRIRWKSRGRRVIVVWWWRVIVCRRRLSFDTSLVSTCYTGDLVTFSIHALNICVIIVPLLQFSRYPAGIGTSS